VYELVEGAAPDYPEKNTKSSAKKEGGGGRKPGEKKKKAIYYPIIYRKEGGYSYHVHRGKMGERS